MAATNAFRNVSNAAFTPNGGNAINITSVLEISFDPGAGFIRDGSDNDATATLTIREPSFVTGRIRLRDAQMADSIDEKDNGTLTFKDCQVAGTNSNVTINNVSTTQSSRAGAWGQLAEYVVAFQGGAVTRS